MSLAQSISASRVLHPSPAPAGSHKKDVFSSIESETEMMFAAIAAKLEREPNLLSVPLSNIDRWLAKGHPSVTRLNAWKSKIEKAMHAPSEFTALLSLLLDSSPEAMQWKGFSPFAGILTPEELASLTWISPP